MRRRLSADEQALWRRVVADVTPLRPAMPLAVRGEPVEAPAFPSPAATGRPFDRVAAKERAVRPERVVARPAAPANTLDASWDRRLTRGIVAPDRIVDLHGHTLASAHAVLDAALDRAVTGGDRVLLVVAGRDRPGPGRGAIRREVGSWLGDSRHAARIAAVRAAHPRHGGAGAFYLILRRSRAEV